MTRFDNINLLRAFAAIAVLIYHVIELGKWTTFPAHGPLLTFRIGWIGVDLFFVISGFVITYSAILLRRENPRDFARIYWSRRLARIVPLHLLTMAVWIAVNPAFFDQRASSSAWQLFTHATFIHNLWPQTHSSINGVNWTLAVEMQFYLAIALLVPWIERTPGWLLWLCCILLAWAWRGSMVVLHGHDDTWHMFMAVSQLPGQMDEFGAGIFLAKLVLAKRPRRAIESIAWLLGSCLFGFLAFSIFWQHASYWDMPGMIVFWRTALAPFLLCVVAFAIWLPQSISKRWLRPLSWLGEISYGIYLWQLVAIGIAIAIGGTRHAVVLAIAVAVTLVLSATSWRYVEKPIIRAARSSDFRVRTNELAP